MTSVSRAKISELSLGAFRASRLIRDDPASIQTTFLLAGSSIRPYVDVASRSSIYIQFPCQQPPRCPRYPCIFWNTQRSTDAVPFNVAGIEHRLQPTQYIKARIMHLQHIRPSPDASAQASAVFTRPQICAPRSCHFLHIWHPPRLMDFCRLDLAVSAVGPSTDEGGPDSLHQPKDTRFRTPHKVWLEAFSMFVLYYPEGSIIFLMQHISAGLSRSTWIAKT